MCPPVKTASFIREGLNAQEGLYYYGLPAWGYLVVGCSGSMIWELSLAPNFILFLLTSMFPCFFRNINPNFEQVASGKKKSKAEGRQSPDGLKHYLGIKRVHKQETTCRPSTHVGRLVGSARVGSRRATFSSSL